MTDVAAQSVERQLSASFRNIKGATVQAYGVDSRGNRCESWEASHMRFTITCAMSDNAVELIREQLVSTGADVSVTAITGTIAGQRSHRRQHRITGLLDDAAAQKLAEIRLQIADEEISTAANVVKEARDEYERLTNRLRGGSVCTRGP